MDPRTRNRSWQLNALLDAEADRLCNAQRYERTEARRDTRAGHYERKLQTKAGEVKLRIPKLRMQTFETAIIERYRRRESPHPSSVAGMKKPRHSGYPMSVDERDVPAVVLALGKPCREVDALGRALAA